MKVYCARNSARVVVRMKSYLKNNIIFYARTREVQLPWYAGGTNVSAQKIAVFAFCPNLLPPPLVALKIFRVFCPRVREALSLGERNVMFGNWKI